MADHLDITQSLGQKIPAMLARIGKPAIVESRFFRRGISDDARLGIVVEGELFRKWMRRR